MTERERLIELLKGGLMEHIGKSCNLAENLAAHLLDNGVIVPPCKVGDTYYTIQRYCNTDPYDTEKEPVMAWDCEKYCGRSDCSFSEYRIEEHKFGTVNFILRTERDFGKTVFLAKEEAEKALEGANNERN
jgi:hypothetical protein